MIVAEHVPTTQLEENPEIHRILDEVGRAKSAVLIEKREAVWTRGVEALVVNPLNGPSFQEAEDDTTIWLRLPATGAGSGFTSGGQHAVHAEVWAAATNEPVINLAAPGRDGKYGLNRSERAQLASGDF